MLEFVNRMRTNPQGHLTGDLFSSLSPLVARDPDAQIAIDFFRDPSSAVLQSEWSLLQPVAPLAWSESLVKSAIAHSDQMIAYDQQSHQLPGEPALGTRVSNARYGSYSAVGENVFAFAKGVFHAHSAFAIDWAVSSRGHRLNIMNPEFRDFGAGIVAENSSATSVGPWVVTQNFASRCGFRESRVVGVVYHDQNSNNRYDAGEGVGGASVTIIGQGGDSFTTQTMSAGGYQLTVPAGTYTVRITGGGLTSPRERANVLVGSENVKVDFSGDAPPPVSGISSPSQPTRVSCVPEAGSIRLSWQPPLSDGGGSITEFRVQMSRDFGRTWADVNPASRPSATTAIVEGVSRSVGYRFRVAAVNAAGIGQYSASSATVSPKAPPAAPSAPRNVAGLARDGSVVLQWMAPLATGGATISSYRVEVSTDSGRTWVAATSAVPSPQSGVSPATTVTGLVNGRNYVFRVAAVNAGGQGAFSAVSGVITPRALVVSQAAPTNVVLRNGVSGCRPASLSWTAPTTTSNQRVLGYVVQLSTDNGTTWRALGSCSSCITSMRLPWELTGVSCSFRVAARTSLGVGEFSTRTTSVTLT
jgi:hypothetical protein